MIGIKALSDQRVNVNSRGKSKTRSPIAPYLFISPFYVLFAVFFVYPLGFAAVLSFTGWDQASPMKWVGVSNYLHFFADPYFRQSVVNTLVYIIGSLMISFLLSLPLAIALNSKRVKGRTFLRILYFTPIVTPGVAVVIVFNMMYDKNFGLLNAVLHLFGIHPIPWLDSTFWSKISVLGLVAWQWTGLNSLYFIAGLQAIPQSLYEAASLDGANKWRLIRHITLPSLSPMMVFVLITSFVGSSQLFDQPFILTNGGPLNSSLSYANYLYQQGLSYLHLGYASAMGMLLLVVVACMSFIQYRKLSRAMQ
ncbi:sugar ABC transporter permease [Alicyclobacillus fastidiosus]|uniref:Sugar ABC transporter permease n=1 Tax=Alicyclobacillus fastidiosus TaxID=392011 RepID=A0ABY6ZJX4_9BACL|nr:sugar ABC transporter permease [Alicyclobacillus fastidiosus]WAH43141.1 sugar ABC transporter permease [Alicyclobacillus fastidiosus]GMA65154.1 sugar ABC transporter permease [Alicyclobacillus fastidiosus]